MKFVNIALILSSTVFLSAQAAETVTTRPILSYQQAKALADKAEQVINTHHIGGAISVVDSAGLPILFESLDGATLANRELAPKKAHSAAAFGVPTATFQQKIAAGNVGLLGNPAVVPLPGGEPIKLNGVVVGAIGISTPNGDVDAQAASAALTALNAD